MTKPFKWACVGDLQMPYHDARAVELFMKVMKAWKPDAIDIVGDVDDQLEYSRFSDGTTDEFFNQIKAIEREDDKAHALWEKEVARVESSNEALVPEKPVRRDANPLPFIKEHALAAREFYTAVRQQHKDADIHASLGNHDIRIFDYIDRKAPEYNDQITPNTLWNLDDLGISWRLYELPPLERFAGIHVHHGVTTTTTGLGVKADIENYGISLVRGHDHRGGVVYKDFPMSGLHLAGMGTGHLCDPSAKGLRYTINPGWEQGFGIVYVVDNKAHLNFIPIRDYMCVVDGRVFQN